MLVSYLSLGRESRERKQSPHKILPVNFSMGNKGCPFFLFKEIEKKTVDKETVKRAVYNPAIVFDPLCIERIILEEKAYRAIIEGDVQKLKDTGRQFMYLGSQGYVSLKG